MTGLRPITQADRSWLEPDFEAYLAEVAPGLTLGPIDRWWREAEREALVIEAPDIAGFAMVRWADEGHWDFSEFYVRPGARRCGIGRAAAWAILTERPGPWSLGVVKTGGARAFWSGLLHDLAEDLTDTSPADRGAGLELPFHHRRGSSHARSDLV